MIDRRTFMTALAATAAIAAAVPGTRAAGEPIRIGEMNSYTRLPAFTLPYRNGWELALEGPTAAGGGSAAVSSHPRMTAASRARR